MNASPLWTSQAMVKAMRASPNVALPEGITGLSIDSRTILPGEAYFAIKGDIHDGHDFVTGALKAGAGLAVVASSQRAKFAADAPLLIAGKGHETGQIIGKQTLPFSDHEAVATALEETAA